MRDSTSKGSAPAFVQGVLLAIAIVLSAVWLYAQQPVLKTVQPRPTSPASGEEMFKAYCAVCHGADAKGKGPAAPALKVEPSDLTVLTKQNKGKFPEMSIYASINGDSTVTAHGTREMPIWGQVFRDLGRDEAQAKLRVRNLTKYIESLQR
jgi:mono/diheme cytochrome c family protein